MIKIIGWLVLYLIVCYLFGVSPLVPIGAVFHAAGVMHNSSAATHP
jgi:hypothetical protein